MGGMLISESSRAAGDFSLGVLIEGRTEKKNIVSKEETSSYADFQSFKG